MHNYCKKLRALFGQLLELIQLFYECVDEDCVQAPAALLVELIGLVQRLDDEEQGGSHTCAHGKINKATIITKPLNNTAIITQPLNLYTVARITQPLINLL